MINKTEMIDFNVNYYVYVKLTNEGRRLLRKNHEDLYADWINTKPEYVETVEDDDGWSKWQMWVLMSELGGECLSGLNLPFETAIRIEVSQ